MKSKFNKKRCKLKAPKFWNLRHDSLGLNDIPNKYQNPARIIGQKSLNVCNFQFLFRCVQNDHFLPEGRITAVKAYKIYKEGEVSESGIVANESIKMFLSTKFTKQKKIQNKM